MSKLPAICDVGLLRKAGFSEDWEKVFSRSSELWGLDIETNLKHDHIWMACVHGPDSHFEFYKPEEFTAWITENRPYGFVAHNGTHFDYPVLERVWGTDLSGLVLVDTFVLLELLNPGTLMTNKALAKVAPEWLGEVHQKGSFPVEQFDLGLTQEMIDYCIQDTFLVQRICVKILKRLQGSDFTSLSVFIESLVAAIIKRQETKGFLLRLAEAQKLSFELEKEKADIRTQMEKAFPPKVTHVQLKTKIRIDTKIFNPGSRQQVAERLIELGWRPKKFTTNSSAPALDGDVLIGLADEIDHPLVHLLSRYFKIVKYTGMVASWIKYADPQNRVHGKVNTNAAVTGRMTHNTPNLGQIPARDPEFGKRCRNLFMVPGEHTLMGSDAKSLEERMLAHYINIPSYTETVLIDGHSMRRDILEFSPDKAGREKAKTWFYAWLYGGGYPKLGSICFEGIPGMSAQEVKNEGERTARLFESKVPGLKKLKSAIQWYFDKGKRIPGLDGRILEIRAKHSQLNTVLQGGGAVVMKMALIFTDKGLSEALGRNSYGFVVNVHDEFQNELHFTDPEKIEIARSITSDSFMNAGKALGIRCPIEADVKIGKSWAETH